MTQDAMFVKVWINMKATMILSFSVLCVLHAKDSSVWYMDWKTQKIAGNLSDPKNSGQFAEPRKKAKEFANPEK